MLSKQRDLFQAKQLVSAQTLSLFWLCLSLGLIGTWLNLVGFGVQMPSSGQQLDSASIAWDSFIAGWLVTSLAFFVFPRFLLKHRTVSLVSTMVLMTLHSEFFAALFPGDSTLVMAITSFILGVGYLWFVMNVYTLVAQSFALRTAIVLILVSQVLEQFAAAGINTLFPPLAEQILCLVLPLASTVAFLLGQRKTRPYKKEAVLEGTAQRHQFVIMIFAFVASVAVGASSSTGIWSGTAVASEDPTFYLLNTVIACALLVVLSWATLYLPTHEPLSSRYQFPFLVLVAQFFILIICDYLFPATPPRFVLIVNQAAELFGHVLTWTLVVSSIKSLRFPPLRVASVGLGTYGLCALGWYFLISFAPSALKVVALLLGYFVIIVIAVHPRIINVFGRATALTKEEMNEYTLQGEPQLPLELSGVAVATTLYNRCVILSERYHLTKRETDILFRLSQGRTQPTIEKDLVLSKGTIKTHIAHIFAKMDVHSRQEILDIVFDEKTADLGDSRRS